MQKWKVEQRWNNEVMNSIQKAPSFPLLLSHGRRSTTNYFVVVEIFLNELIHSFITFITFNHVCLRHR
jgi:hypothetical protein